MKFFAIALASVLAASALAQGTFTIRRPADGSRVREVVSVRIPKNSIPEGGYLGIIVNGRFLEAVIPPVQGEDYVYSLDTKARRLPDGPLTIEAVLYLYTQNAPVVLNRSAVTVNLDNSASLQANRDGFRLRYRFNPGREYVYNRRQSQSVSFVSQAQAQLGSRAPETPTSETNVRYKIAVDNSFRGGAEGLIRIQAMPERGKDYAMLIVAGATEPQRFFDYMMAPIFMRITNTGREIFSSLPPYFPFEGTAGEASRTDLFALFPPPVLPSREVSIGDAWQSALPEVELDLEQRNTRDRFIRYLPGRSVLEGVEWEQGIPTARIRSEISVGQAELQGAQNLGGQEGVPVQVKIESVKWIALDRGILVREERRETRETLVTVGGGGAGVGGGAGFGPPGGPPGRRGPGGFQGAGEMEDRLFVPGTGSAERLFQQFTLRARQAGVGAVGGISADGPEGGEAPGFGGRGPGAMGSPQGVRMILRVTSQWVTTLER